MSFYEITAPVSCSRGTANLLTIDTNGFVLTTNNIQIGPLGSANFISLGTANTLVANYTVQWPNAAPSANQSLAISEDGFSQKWYDLESPTTLIVRSNPAPGQFQTVSQAVSFINAVANPNVTYTIWLAPGAHSAAAIPNIQYSTMIVGAGMFQTIFTGGSLTFSNLNPPQSKVFNFGLQNLSYGGGFIFVRTNTNLYFKNLGVIGNYTNFNYLFNLGTFQQNNPYICNMIGDRIWQQEIGNPSYAQLMILNGLSGSNIQTSVTSNITLTDLNLHNRFEVGPVFGDLPIFSGITPTGTFFTMDKSFINISGTVTTAINLGRIGGFEIKDCVLTGRFLKILDNRSTNTFCSISQVEGSPVNDWFVFGDNFLPLQTITPFVNSDGEIGPQKTHILTQRNGSSFTKFDKSDKDGRKYFNYYEDFTSPSFPYTDTKWQVTLEGAGSISNVLLTLPTANVFRDGDIVINTTAASDFVSLSRSLAATPLTHGTFVRFEAGVQPQSIFSAGSSPSFVVGLGDNADSSFAGNTALAFGNSAIYFGFGPDYTSSPNWYCYSRDVLGVSSLDSGVPLASNLVTLEFDFKRLATPVVDYYINERFIGSLSTNIPITGANVVLSPVIKQIYSSGSGGSVAVDYVSYYARSNILRKL